MLISTLFQVLEGALTNLRYLGLVCVSTVTGTCFSLSTEHCLRF